MKKTFDTLGGNFEACREAEEWCNERGIAVGVMERNQPRGLLLEHCWISKWSNISEMVRRQMDGTMTGDMRHGPVVIELKGDESRYRIIPEKYR